MDNVDKKYIVGIGASAGGLEALQDLLSSIPTDTDFSYLIVQHMSPDYKSLMTEILGKYTEMPVVQVEDGMKIAPNTVYIIQPGKNMKIVNGKIELTAQKEKELNLPIDLFFSSLAEEAGGRAIAIVLSGTGSDGTNGIKDIKEHDGLIMVQSLDSCKFDGMPKSALRTGLVDAELTMEEMALEIGHISEKAKKNGFHIPTERELDEELLKKIYIILKKVCNINFSNYKQTTICRRIERRMMLVHKDSLADYVEYLYECPEEVKTLSKEVLIGVTSFFRDAEFFKILKNKALQEIVIHSEADVPIRIWVAGCSTGEEAYSIAIIISEVMESLKIKRAVKIFATDLDSEAINIASKGAYGDNIVNTVSASRLSRYFTRKNNAYVINREIRKMIVFSPHNVFQDPPFGKLDLISCRNMLIYFQPVLQNDLFAIFHSALKNGGYLFLGKSEAMGTYAEAFPTVDAVAKIFIHRSDVNIPGQKSIPFLQSSFMSDDMSSIGEIGHEEGSTSDDFKHEDENKINNMLLESFMPACLVVDEKNEIVHIYGESSNYLHMPAGKFTNNIFELITDGMKIPVSTLLKESRKDKCQIQYKNIQFTGEREQVVVNLTAMPISKNNMDNNLYALVFTEVNAKVEVSEEDSFDINSAAAQRITDLEQELSDVQMKLDQSKAEQECVNEELQAANEELLTANEELQSSNEELQSVNEELYTVNGEYQQKLTELADVNDDIANFLSSTLTGIILVDNKLNIRRYTDYVTTEFSVMDHDIGRSLGFISYHFPKVDITEICENVLHTLVPDEREIVTTKNKVFFMRVAPYRSMENKILGCVLTLIDITKQKMGQVQLKNTEQQLSDAKSVIDANYENMNKIINKIQSPIDALEKYVDEIAKQFDGQDGVEQNLQFISKEIKKIAAYMENEVHPDHIENVTEGDVTVTEMKEDKSLEGRRVLVADDNGINRKILCAILKKEKMEYTEAIDGEHAIEMYMKAEENYFDFILMDMRMPKLDGIRATHQIRISGREDATSIPIIGVSANNFDEDIKKAKSAGVNIYTTKPVDKQQLVSIMKSFI